MVAMTDTKMDVPRDAEHSDEIAGPPRWMAKHPCTGCGTGYGACSQGYRHDLMCCANCEHPGRWVDAPYTYDEVVEMWERAGRTPPPHVQRWLAENAPSFSDSLAGATDG